VEEMHNCSPNMQAAFLALPPETVKELEAMAEEGLNDWQQRTDDLEREAEFGADNGTYTMAPLDDRFTVLGWSRVQRDSTENEVCVVHDVMTPAQCDAILLAVQSRADVRGGWDTTRHRYYPTTDMRLVEACKDAPEVEQLIRQIVFEKICKPLATRWGGAGFLPEHLVFTDLFFVHYSAEGNEQRGLEMHRDGSLFSFNVLLNDPSEFDDGGTFFAIPGWPVGHGKTVTLPRGHALVHSGSMLHGARDITRGRRDILVGFMGRPKIDRCTAVPDGRAAAPHRSCHRSANMLPPAASEPHGHDKCGQELAHGEHSDHHDSAQGRQLAHGEHSDHHDSAQGRHSTVPSSHGADVHAVAARDGFLKFGTAAWSRSQPAGEGSALPLSAAMDSEGMERWIRSQCVQIDPPLHPLGTAPVLL